MFNVLVDANGDVFLIDFDRASLTSDITRVGPNLSSAFVVYATPRELTEFWSEPADDIIRAVDLYFIMISGFGYLNSLARTAGIKGDTLIVDDAHVLYTLLTERQKLRFGDEIQKAQKLNELKQAAETLPPKAGQKEIAVIARLLRETSIRS